MNSGIARGQTLQVAGGKCTSKKMFPRPKQDFAETSTLFRRSFIAKEFQQCLIFRKCKFLFE